MKKTGWIRLLGVLLAVALLGSLTACGGGKKFTVTFDSDGGSVVSSIDVSNGKTVEEPTAPTKDGYTFVKWVKSDGSEFGFGTEAVKESMTLKAIWQIDVFTVTFHTNGGTSVNAQEVEIHGKVTKPADPIKAGCAFGGWYTDASYTTRFDFASEITQNTVIYAYFTPEIKESFTVTFVGSDTPIAPMKTSGGVLAELPVPVKAGKTFVGWWMSDFEDGNKLTCRYINQVLTQNTTLFAVWESSAPEVSVTSEGVSWKSKGVNVTYKIVITSPEGDSVSQSQSTVTYAYDFANRSAGEYKIEVTWNNNTTTVYYNNKALSRVCLFEADGFLLKYNAVANAEKYLITVVCGDKDQSHTDLYTEYDNGLSTVFDFKACEMQEGGITFTVKAIADGYVSSESEPFVFERALDRVSGITVNAETEQFSWDKVENAQYYMVKINDGDYRRVDDLTSLSVKESDAGKIQLTIYAVAHGWNASEPVTYTYNKVRLATPSPADIKIEGQTLSWAPITGATGYRVKIGEHVYNVSGNSMDVPGIFDGSTNMNVSVQALSAVDAKISLFSDIKTFATTLEGQVSYENGTVGWSTIIIADKYAVRVNGGDAVETSDTSLAVSFDRAGKNTVEVCYYYGDNVSAWEKISVTTYAVTLAYNFEGYENYAVLYRAQGDELKLPDIDVSLPGYEFRYWLEESDDVVAYIKQTLETAADLTLYAKWEPKQYRVAFSFGSESGTLNGESESTVTYRKDFKLPTLTSLDPCKTFYGWYESPNGQGIRYTDSEGNGLFEWNQTENKTLYAGWIDLFTFERVEDSVYGTMYSVAKGEGIDLVSSIKIPAYYNGLRVAYIYSTAFESCKNLEVVEIPDTVLQVDTGSVGGNRQGSAFLSCNNIREVNVYVADPDRVYETFYWSQDGVLFRTNNKSGLCELAYYPIAKTGAYTIPNGVHVIPQYVFGGTKIEELTIPSDVIRIDAYAFGSSSSDSPAGTFVSCNYLTKIVFTADSGDTLSINALAFGGLSKLTEITLPSRISEFDPTLLSACYNLETVNFVGEDSDYASIDGFVTDAAKTTLVYAPAGKSGEVTIPAGIKTIGEAAFANPFTYQGESRYRGTSIEKLIIPGYVTKIEKDAFRGNNSIVSITFDEESTLPLTIGESAFYNCKALKTLTLPVNLMKLGKYAFGNTELLSRVTVNSSGLGGDLDFEAGAFGSMPTATSAAVTYYVTELYLGPQTPAFGIAETFGAMLVRVVVDPANANLASDEDGILYNKAFSEILFYPTGRYGEFVVPETVTKIGANVFSNKSNLTGITIPGSVTEIGEAAFKNSESLAFVKFEGEGVALTVGNSAFYGCKALTEISLPNYCTEIGAEAFAWCSGITSVTVPGSVKTVGDSAFRYCQKLATVTLEEGVETLGRSVFYGCYSSGNSSGLETVNLPATLTTIGEGETGDAAIYGVFDGCKKLSRINVADGNAKFASVDGLLYGKKDGVITDLCYCPIRASGVVDIPQTVASIAAKAFYQNSGVTEIKFSNGITGDKLEIGTDAFAECVTLAKVALPRGLKTVESGLFKKCTALTEVVIPNTVTKLEVDIFSGCTALSTVTFEDGGTEALVMADGEDQQSTGSGEKYYYYHGVFAACTALKEITLPERTSNIGAYAFSPYYNKSAFALEKITIPASVTKIGAYAFGISNGSVSVNQLTTVIFAEGSKLTTIETGAFYNCKKLTSLDLPESVTSIGANAFNFCSGLISIAFGEDSRLTEIGDGAFTSCSSLSAITIPAGMTSIGKSMFSGCASLKAVNFAQGSELTTVGESAFANTPITSISIPATVTSIGKFAFSGCSALSELTFESFTEGDDAGKCALKEIGDSAFAKTALTEFRFPVSTADSVKLGSGLFTAAKQLATVTLSKSITNISGVFTKSYVKNIVVEPDNENFKADATAPVIYNVQGTTIQLTYGAMYGEDGVYYIPEGTTEIGDGAFANQVYIKKMVIPRSVQTIGASAFENCLNLEEVVFLTDANDGSGKSNLTTLGSKVFNNCRSLKSIDLSKTQVTFLPDYTFNNCYALESVELPASLQSIGVNSNKASTTSVYTFANCTSLKSIALPDSVKYINGSYNFRNCTSLTSVTLPSSLVLLGQNTFVESGLKEVTFQSNVTTWGSAVFGTSSYLSSLTKVTLYSGMTTLGTSAFADCPELTTVTFNGYTGAGNALPDNLTTLKGSTFKNDTALTNLTMPGVTTIGSSEFSNCTSLTSVTLKDTVTALGSNMFEGCTSLTSIRLPSSLTYLGTSTFKNSGLTSITIPEKVIHLGSTKGKVATMTSNVGIFEGCANLTNVTLPSGLLSMGAKMFYNCTNLTSITYTGYTGKGNSLPESTTLVAVNAFSGCTSLKQLDLPGVTQLGKYAFGAMDSDISKGTTYASGIETVSLPALVYQSSNSNYMGTFMNCTSLVSVTLNDAMTGLNNSMFTGCTSLKSIELPSALTFMGTNTFENSGIESIVIPQNVVHIGSSQNKAATATTGVKLFKGCESLTSVTLPAGLQTIGENVFYGCKNLTQVTYTGYEGEGNSLPAGTTVLGRYAFEECSALEQIALPGVTTIGEYPFRNCSALKEVTLGDRLTSLPNGAFYQCSSLETVNFGTALTTVSSNAFCYCTSLTEIALPDTLKSLGANAFFGSGLTTIELPATCTSVGNAAFSACKSLTAITVADGNTAFKADSNGFLYQADGTLIYVPESTSGTVELTEDCTAIGAYAFNGCNLVTEVIIPSSVTSIGASAFYGTGITSIVIPESVTSIGNSAFRYTKLETVTVPGAVTFGTYVFAGCENLTSVTLCDDITALGNYMFSDCTSLEAIELPSELTFMGNHTFINSGLKSIVIPEKVEHLGQDANKAAEIGYTKYVNLFENCVNLVSVELPAGLQTIGSYTFYNCANLSSITYTGYTGQGNALPESVTLVAAYVFSGCTSLEQLDLPGVTELGNYTFGASASDISNGKTTPSGIKTVSLPALTATSDKNHQNNFENCTSLVSVTLNDELTALNHYMFKGCTSLKTITLPSALTFLGTYTFQNSGLESIVIPEKAVHIGATADKAATVTAAAYVFDGCTSLTSVTLPSALMTVGGYVFRNCSSLTTVAYTGYTGAENTLPESTTLVGTYAFSGCTSLEQLSLPGVLTTGTAVFGAKDEDIEKGTTVPSGIRRVSLPSIVTMGGNLFQNCTSLETVVLNEELTKISSTAFAGCTSLKNISMPSALTEIATSAFEGCTGLKEFYIPAIVTVGGTAFKGWTAEQTVYVTDSLYVVVSGGSYAWIDTCGAKIEWEYSAVDTRA